MILKENIKLENTLAAVSLTSKNGLGEPSIINWNFAPVGNPFTNSTLLNVIFEVEVSIKGASPKK